MKKRHPILWRVFEHFGSASALARNLNLTRAAVSAWTHIPWIHVRRIEELTGIPKEELRPDVYK
jgi:DNA-binding transcriptional regulator YdaS (Cro superfamily)